jgi:3-oxoacyl-[acyl-carrier protein] reductase
MMRLANKVAIITGGGSGIGKASAHLFAKEGAKVVVAQRTVSTGEETVSTIQSRGGKAIFVRTDVTIASEVENLVEVALANFGKIDILFNNAGIIKIGPIEEIDEFMWEQIFAVNVKGIFLLTKHTVPVMKRAMKGVIINNASTGAIRPRMFFSAYAGSKGAVIALTKALALELAPFNIRVNCVVPGFTETPMIEVLNEKQKKAVADTIPLRGRAARPEDTAYAALYLASDEASALTGASILVDGGRCI